ncbi:Oxidoreductase NAD-binding domain-containing protein 1 [Seminavis robusta]|uniref:Oxidoreductase NAD-binding domain-containing protein 1 n=1 Tax=Seminavis robusta TaxID=568900 RepID=A0A9N8F3B5_9STRA|nr:Oxidoreductase NAD-binding domain-containing protein 1 [Seminavis robusta]|eukprot:Sro2599_g332240.1 Oxidoreductase NAD-binding domain-containing protein 1 (267) ;mRNA; r:3515-4315
MTTLPASGYHVGKILARRVASPTVVVLDLEVPSSLQFQPGQWLDFVVPPYEWVGGFSTASQPEELPKITLAIKESNHPPSRWVHSQESTEIGRTVHVQVGGTCVLDTTTRQKIETQPVVFCAGGIGISPVLSMYRQWTQLLQKSNNQNPPPSSFLYSVSTEEELVFGDELVQTLLLAHNTNSSHKNRHSLCFSLTQQTAWKDSSKQDLESKGVQCRTGRFMKEFLTEADDTSAFYLCGPPAMLDEGVDLLRKRGIADTNIHFERWW